MPVRTFKPTSPGRRGKVGPTFEEISSAEPERSLLIHRKKHGGRNAYGRITVRHHGGGERRRIRQVDFKRDKPGIAARVTSIQYDPNRSARIALLTYSDGEKRYVLAPLEVKVGDLLMSGPQAEIRPGNAMPISQIPVGTLIHNVELRAGRGGQLVRSAGTAAQLLAKEGEYAQVRLPSGEVRLVRMACYATIGVVSNPDQRNIKRGKAGSSRHRGIRPTVRGSAMSPRDHPHGGGEGRQPIGLPGPKSPWGKPTLGKRTRNNKRTDRYIVRRRTAKRK